MSTRYSQPPTTAQIDRMTDEERADVIGWLRHELRVAEKAKDEGYKTKGVREAEMRSLESEIDAAQRRHAEIKSLLAVATMKVIP